MKLFTIGRLATVVGLMVAGATTIQAAEESGNAIRSTPRSRVTSSDEIAKSRASSQKDRLAISPTDRKGGDSQKTSQIAGTRATPNVGRPGLSALKPLKNKAAQGPSHLGESEWASAFEGITATAEQSAGSITKRDLLQPLDHPKTSGVESASSFLLRQDPSERIGINFNDWPEN